MRGRRAALYRGAGPEAPRRDWLVAALAAAGLLVAGSHAAAANFAAGTAPFCAVGSGCETVQASRYAVFLGVPTALWGAALYGGIGALALLGLDARRWLAAFLLAVAAVSFSALLIGLQVFVIGAVCVYCLLSAGVAAGLFGFLLVRRPDETERRRVLRPGPSGGSATRACSPSTGWPNSRAWGAAAHDDPAHSGGSGGSGLGRGRPAVVALPYCATSSRQISRFV